MKTKKVNKPVKLEKKTNQIELGRGKITDNFLAALVTSKAYQMQVVQAKKGKGSYCRKAKNKRGESYLMVA